MTTRLTFTPATIEDAIRRVRKMRREVIVGPELRTHKERRLWERTRYRTLRDVEDELIRMLQEVTS